MADKTLKAELDKKEEAIMEFYPKYIEISNKIDQLGNKINLFLDPEEANHKRIEDSISRIYNTLHKKDMKNLKKEEIESELSNLIKESRIVLKQEWKNSKKPFKI